MRSIGPITTAWAELRLLGSKNETRPDIVVFLVDTLRADHISSYGYYRNTTPNIDRLAEESLLFTRCNSASTWTLPSAASLLSGLPPEQHGVLRSSQQLSPDITTLAERLRAHGYRTVGLTDGGYMSYTWGLGQGFSRYDVTSGAAWQPKDVERISKNAKSWISKNRFHPFFLLIHTYETHQPYTNQDGFANRFLDPQYIGEFKKSAFIDPDLSEKIVPA